jgi:hypothetical protein
MALLRRSVAEVKRAQSEGRGLPGPAAELLAQGRRRPGPGQAERVMEAAFGSDDEQNASSVVHLLRGESGDEHSKRAVNLSVLVTDLLSHALLAGRRERLTVQKTRREAFLGAVESGRGAHRDRLSPGRRLMAERAPPRRRAPVRDQRGAGRRGVRRVPGAETSVRGWRGRQGARRSTSTRASWTIRATKWRPHHRDHARPPLRTDSDHRMGRAPPQRTTPDSPDWSRSSSSTLRGGPAK